MQNYFCPLTNSSRSAMNSAKILAHDMLYTTYSSCWILCIVITNVHEHYRVCRAQWLLTLTYIFKVIQPWFCHKTAKIWHIMSCRLHNAYTVFFPYMASMITSVRKCVMTLKLSRLYSTALVQKIFCPGRMGNSTGSDFTHRPTVAKTSGLVSGPWLRNSNCHNNIIVHIVVSALSHRQFGVDLFHIQHNWSLA